MYKNIYVDMDGTIINSEHGVLHGITYALEQHGYEVPDYPTLRSCIGPPFTYSFPNILHIKDEDFFKVVKTYRDIYDTEVMFDCEIYPGVAEFLKRMAERGYSITLASSKDEGACRKILEKLNVDQYFTEIVGASIYKKIDTKTLVLEECFNRCPWHKREETVLIGDTRYDVVGAVETGIDCIGVTYGFGTREDLLEHGAKAVFDELTEVAEYIEKYQ